MVDKKPINFDNKEQFYAIDEPSSRDYKFSDIELSGANKKRPKAKVRVQNQLNTPACTVFSATHISNGLNILEDELLHENRPQAEASVLRNNFCSDRNLWNTGSSIQTVANWMKKNGLIEGYVTINGSKDTQIAQMKSAIDMGYFLSTGSSNGDWAEIKKTGIYTVRKDNMFVGHAWCIVDYGDDFFRAINSYGNWGPYNGYFKVPFDMVDKIYSKLAFIDKSDKDVFHKVEDYNKAKEMIGIAKLLYSRGTPEQKAYFEKIQLSTNLETLYSVK